MCSKIYLVRVIMSFNGTKAFSIDASIFRCLIVLGLMLSCEVECANGRNVSENVIIADNADTKVQPINYRLPNNAKPESYDITLDTNIDQNDFNFSGRVAIKLRVLEASYNITIHARQLNIKTVQLSTTAGTYAVAFIISDLDYREFNATNEYSTMYRAFAVKDYVNQTSYSLNFGVDVINALDNYLSVPYVLPKLDQVAMPEKIGAMENWGLVIYPKQFFVCDPATDSDERKMTVTDTVAHELSHQWFGNLVTTKWWSQIWLNEGFSTLFCYIAIDLVHPQWNYFQRFITTYLHPTLIIDAQADQNPMNFYSVGLDPSENLNLDIVYYKGAAVIRMFMHAIGKETFKKALNTYLTNNSFSSVDENSLFEHFDMAIAEECNKALPEQFTMKNVFGSWTNQKGFPVLKVTRNYKNGTIALYQQKYDAIYKPNETIDSAMWWIPYNFASATNAVFNVTTPAGLLSNSERTKLIEPTNSNVKWTNNDWLLFNIQQTGYYRVWYDDENYKLLSKELNDGNLNKIHPTNRAQILDDLHNLVDSGRVSAKILCDIMTYLRRETSYIAWETARKIIRNWHWHLQASKKLTDFRNLVVNLVEPLYQKKTLNMVDGEEIFDRVPRNIAVELACEFGVSQCLKETYAKFQEYINGAKISRYIRGAIVANGIRSASDDEIAKLWEIFLNCPSDDERREILSSFANIPSESTIEIYLSKSIDGYNDSSISLLEYNSLITSLILNNQNTLSFFIRFLTKHSIRIDTAFKSPLVVFEAIAGQSLTAEVKTQFFELLMVAETKELISVDDVADLKSSIATGAQLKTEILNSFERDFFTGKCTGFKNE